MEGVGSCSSKTVLISLRELPFIRGFDVLFQKNSTQKNNQCEKFYNVHTP